MQFSIIYLFFSRFLAGFLHFSIAISCVSLHNTSMKIKDLLFTIIMLTLATGAAFLLFRLVPENMANVALLYIVALILIARYTTGYFYGIFASLFCVIVINYCFTYPYFALNFTLTGYPITFLEILSISLITSTTTSHMIRQSQILSERERELMEADKEKMRANLLRAVSHDLRTPLTSIIGTASSYADGAAVLTENEKKAMIEHINEDSHWLLNMVDNLLSVTRIQNDTTTVKKTSEIVEEVIEEAVNRLKRRIPDAAIIVNIPDEPLMVPMDAMLIEQVIINLLENAIIHAKSALPVELTVTATDTTAVFHVVDHGIGIQEDRLTSIFDGAPDSDSGSSSSDSKKGIGIGLSICKTIILAHQGTITARNHTDGAEFQFELPREVENE